MLFALSYILFYKKSENSAIKFKYTLVRIEINNYLLVYLNKNISKEVNIKAHKSFPLALWRGGGALILAKKRQLQDGQVEDTPSR